jgi:hypothetical protein
MVTIHAGFMLAGFFSMAAGAATVMFMRDKSWWLRVHRRLASAGVICILLGFMAALVMVSRQTGQHLAVPHAWLGLAAILSALCTLTLGVTQLKRKTVGIRTLHRWSGRVTLALLFFNAVSGLFLAGILPTEQVISFTRKGQD